MSIAEVAQRAGVSTATVSRVINNSAGVRVQTARQVRDAMRAMELDAPLRAPMQEPASPRAPLQRNRRRIQSIVVLTLGGRGRHWLQVPLRATAFAGVTRAAKESGLRLLLDESLDLSPPHESLLSRFADLARKADGALLFAANEIEHAHLQVILAAMGRILPVVRAMGNIDGPAVVDQVAPDHQAIGYLALRHLASQGCRRVAFVCAEPQWALMRLRGQAFATAAHQRQLPWSFYLIGDDRREVGRVFPGHTVVRPTLAKLVDRLLVSPRRPDGLFIANDALTVEVLPLLQQRLEIGRDLAIISCDNQEVCLSGLDPRPPSIEIGAEEIGWRAVHRLMQRMNHPQEPAVLISVAPRMDV